MSPMKPQPLNLLTLPFIEASNYTPAERTKVDLLILHSTESLEKAGTARNVAAWFAGETAPQASAHYIIDPGEVIRCVPDECIAWQAPGANSKGIGIELCGRAAQSEIEWADEDSMAILAHAIDLCELLAVFFETHACWLFLHIFDYPARRILQQ